MIELIGLLAGLMTTLCTVPQVVYVARTGKTRDLTWGWLGLLIGGCLLWAVYGALRGDLVLFGANTLTLALNGYLALRKGRNVVIARQAWIATE